MEEKNGGRRLAADPKQKKKHTAALVGGIAAAVLLSGYLALCAYAGSGGGLMAPGTVIGGVEVGGQSVDGAAAALDAALQNRLGELKVEFTCGGKVYAVPGTEFTYQASELVRSLSPAAAPFPARGFKFLGGMLNRKGTSVPLTLDHVPQEVNRAARECGDQDAQTTWQIQETAVTFTKGRTGRTVDVEGLLPSLEQRAGQLLNEGGETPKTPLEVSVSVAPPAEPDLEAIRRELYTQVADAYLDQESLEIVPSVEGKDLDVEAARAALEQAEEGKTFRVELTITQPQVSTEELNESLFRDVLGEATTRVTGTADRKMNVGVAAAFIDGTILFPEEEFSFNKVCSPYAVSNGYGKATAYVNGLSKDTVAGGICQASSTLYWASLKANLETVERYAHRYEPSYVKGGLDATVYGDFGDEGSLDFRFKNSSQAPIKIQASMDEKNNIHVTILGTDSTGIHGEPYSTNRVVTQAYKTVYQADESVPQGTTKKDAERTGYNGVSIETYQKLVDAEGKVISETLLYKTKYHYRDEIILFHPGDLALWGIDPYTGLRAEPTPTPESPAASGEPTGSPDPEGGEPGPSQSPGEETGEPLLPPVETAVPEPTPEQTPEPAPEPTPEPVPPAGEGEDLPILMPPGSFTVSE